MLKPIETRALLESIDVSTVVGLRDRPLIGLMTYASARVGAAPQPGARLLAYIEGAGLASDPKGPDGWTRSPSTRSSG